MSWLDRLIQAEERMVDEAVRRERERCAKLADQWAAAREPEHGGNALRNFAAALRAGERPDGVGSAGKVGGNG
jgi:hypothetical protein